MKRRCKVKERRCKGGGRSRKGGEKAVQGQGKAVEKRHLIAWAALRKHSHFMSSSILRHARTCRRCLRASWSSAATCREHVLAYSCSMESP